MNKEMIVSSNGHETRVAILEEDLVAEIFIERERQRGVVGNVYKGRVSKVLPGMQSSFIDCGLERDGFLYVADVIATPDEFDRLESGELEDDPRAEQAEEPNGVVLQDPAAEFRIAGSVGEAGPAPSGLIVQPDPSDPGAES